MIVEQVDENQQKIKCVVWDLDNTLWEGVLLEDKDVFLREDVVDIIKTLDNRGILQAIASKNEHDSAITKLKEFGIYEFFLYPQINWNSKSTSVKKIAELINIGMDSIAFIDDQIYECEEVKFSWPEVLCINVNDIKSVLNMPQFNPRFITEDSKKRREMYLCDIKRKKQEDLFEGPKEEFLSSLNMVFTISIVKEGDLQRAEELSIRTHQLNSTGYTYSYEELDELRKSDKHKLLITSLDDNYGTYGKIGLSLIQCDEKIWTIKLLLMSCRVMSRGVGSVLLNYIMKLAKKSNVKLRAEFVSNDRNKMMYITYVFAGFKEIENKGDLIILENNLSCIQDNPNYIKVIEE